MPIKIIGGSSGSGRVSILSEEYCATARYSKSEGTITCEIKPLPSLVRFIVRAEKKYFVPRIVKILCFFLGSITLLDFLFITLLVTGVHLIVGKFEDAAILQYKFVPPLLVLALFLFITRTKVSGWHGAEHMTIAAYERSETTELDAICRESPVNPKCGGRLVLPILILMFASLYLFSHWMFLVTSIEATLWIDKKIGFDKIPAFSHFSVLLQSYITTTNPTRRQLHTARIAMAELIAKHRAGCP